MGCDRSIAEISVSVTTPSAIVSLQWGRDLSVAEIQVIPNIEGRQIGFNGAATFRSRKYRSPSKANCSPLASMGPRPFGRGNVVLQEGALLQRAASMGPRPFGRGNGAWKAYCDAVPGASMGPRPFGRGNIRPISRREAMPDASMGPRPFGRGNAETWNAYALAYRLQWGRDLSVAEMSSAFSKASWKISLQWGRDLSVAEILPRLRELRDDLLASMGPRPFGRGNGRAQADMRLACRASMGPRPFGRGNAWVTLDGTNNMVASMGPRPFGRGNGSRVYNILPIG